MFRLWKQLRTEYVQVWSVLRCLLLGEKKNPLKSIWLLSVCVFPTVNVFLEGDRAGSWWKPFIFLDEAGFTLAMTWRRGWEPSGWEGPRTMSAGGPITLHWMWFWGAPQQNQCNGPRIPSSGTESNHGFRLIHSLSPCIYPHTPLTVTRLGSFSPHGGGSFTKGSSQTITLLQAIDDVCNDQCQACIHHTRIFFPKMFN